MLEVCTSVGKSLQGMRQIERRGKVIAICTENCVHHRQVLGVVLCLAHSNTHI